MQGYVDNMKIEIADIYLDVYKKLIEPVCTKHLKESWEEYYALVKEGKIVHKPEQCDICRSCEVQKVHSKMIVFRDVHGINKYMEDLLDARNQTNR